MFYVAMYLLANVLVLVFLAGADRLSGSVGEAVFSRWVVNRLRPDFPVDVVQNIHGTVALEIVLDAVRLKPPRLFCR